MKDEHAKPVQWLQADACSLPFADRMFDAVVCQFGLMFVPDKALAARETYRVLKPGGLFLFNVWDAMEQNALPEIAHHILVRYFVKDPLTFYEVPFGYHDQDEIRRVLEEAGFSEIKVEVVAKLSVANRAEDAAAGLVWGNPVADAIATRDPASLPIITDAVAKAIKDQFGSSEIRAPVRALVAQGRA
jgi:ubiquinone/menaquinone biosynthesis C-methylase UbiE